MHISGATLLFLLFANTESALIKPTKLCKDCKHFIVHKGECALFGDPDFVNGKHVYKRASTARACIRECGEEGTYFVENTNKVITVPYYLVLGSLDNWPIMVILSLYIFYFTQVLDISHDK